MASLIPDSLRLYALCSTNLHSSYNRALHASKGDRTSWLHARLPSLCTVCTSSCLLSDRRWYPYRRTFRLLFLITELTAKQATKSSSGNGQKAGVGSSGSPHVETLHRPLTTSSPPPMPRPTLPLCLELLSTRNEERPGDFSAAWHNTDIGHWREGNEVPPAENGEYRKIPRYTAECHVLARLQAPENHDSTGEFSAVVSGAARPFSSRNPGCVVLIRAITSRCR
jgi:hypothetical protein